MNKRDIKIASLLLLGIALLPALYALSIDWIQFDERAVGENSPYYDDVVNRPAKQMYALYTTEHNPDGTHKALSGYATSDDLNSYMLISAYDGDADTRADAAEALSDGANISSAASVRSHLDDATIHRSINDASTSATSLWSSSKIATELSNNAAAHIAINDSTTATDSVWSSNKTNSEIATALGSVSVSEYALRGSGSGYIAYATFAPAGFFTGNDAFSLYGIVIADQLNRAESLYQHVETEYSTTVLNFGKTADNKLQLTLGANTYTSGVVWTTDTIDVPVEVGVVCNKTGGALWFFFNGAVEASQAATYTFPAINANEVHSIGNGLDGDVFAWHVTKGLLFNASTKHTPIGEGLSQCPACLASYDMDATSGSTLTDRYVEQKGSGTAHNLTVNGTWQEYARGY